MTEAYQQGFNAFYNKESVLNNPYAEGTSEHKAWSNGYTAAIFDTSEFKDY